MKIQGNGRKTALFQAAALLLALTLLSACGTPAPPATPIQISAPASTANSEPTATAAPTTTPAPAPQAPQIPLAQYPVVDGSTATIPLGIALIQQVAGISQQQAEETVYHSTTAQSYRNLMDETADILIVYAPPSSVQQEMDASGQAFLTAPIGRDALVFLLSEDNPVSSLTQQQLVDIYAGKTTRWNQVNGADLPIVAFQRDEESGSQTLMKKLCMKDTPMMDAPTEQRPTAMGELIDVLAKYRGEANAIGYSVYYYAQNMYERPGLKLLAVDGVTPDNQSIGAGDYPYVNDFFCVIRADEAADSPTRQLYDYLTGDGGAALIESCGYVPVK